jgi:hypothetical protein
LWDSQIRVGTERVGPAASQQAEGIAIFTTLLHKRLVRHVRRDIV